MAEQTPGGLPSMNQMDPQPPTSIPIGIQPSSSATSVQLFSGEGKDMPGSLSSPGLNPLSYQKSQQVPPCFPNVMQPSLAATNAQLYICEAQDINFEGYQLPNSPQSDSPKPPNNVVNVFNNVGHHLSEHEVEKLYKCTSCPKQFNKRIDLKRHMYLHSGEKPFTCEHCGKGFTRKANMRKHLQTHLIKVVGFSDDAFQPDLQASGYPSESDTLLNALNKEKSDIGRDARTANISRKYGLETNTLMSVNDSINYGETNSLGSVKIVNDRRIGTEKSTNLEIDKILSVEKERSDKPVTENETCNLKFEETLNADLIDNKNRNVTKSSNNSYESQSDLNVDCAVKREMEIVEIKEEGMVEENFNFFEATEQLYADPLETAASNMETISTESQEGTFQPAKMINKRMKDAQRQAKRRAKLKENPEEYAAYKKKNAAEKKKSKVKRQLLEENLPKQIKESILEIRRAESRERVTKYRALKQGCPRISEVL
ncbi:unnamed protein product [Meganyctiphanes norvegica]|uniref:C2H2-type domain-containing protein n=1 Tax=Meganyctiphanes norvegica TaxID=48144 RepID=A0AAV2SRZ2_MEGNR